MTHVHYKFSSKLSYNTVVFDGPHITLNDLKRQIMGREKLRAADCDLQITNAQTKEEYTDNEDVIPKGSSVIVRRIPIIGVKASSSNKTHNTERSDGQFHRAFGASRAMDGRSSTKALSYFSKIQMANLVDADVSEEDKIRVIMNQSSYDSMNLNPKIGTVLPENYTCYRCGNTGHHIRNCPISADKNFDGPPRIKKSTGIPRSFMVEVDNPNIKGVMLTNCGRYAIPAIDAEAYAIGKKERPPFIPQERPKSEAESDPIPDELLCLICHDLLGDAVVIPCCGNSYCDDCIRTALLDSEDHVCPTCGQSDVSPDTLIANKFLRQAVNNFKKEQCQDKSLRERSGTSQSQNETPTPTPTPSPAPIPPNVSMQSPLQRPLQTPYNQQDCFLNHPKTVKTAPLPQAPDAPSVATDPPSVDSTSKSSIQPGQSIAVISNNEAEGKTHSDSAAAAPSVLAANKDPPGAPSQLIPLVNHTQVAELPQTVSENQRNSSSDSAPRLSGSSASWDSTSSSAGCPTGGLTESTIPQPSTSSSLSLSSYTTTPSPLFPSPLFHTLIPTHQPNSGYPPGYPPATPNWTLRNPRDGPIPSLCSSASTSSIPVLIPNEWYRPQRKKKERSPHRHSSSLSKSTKSKSARSYSRSSSRSGSRSRSRSRPRSSYSSNRLLNSRSHNPSYNYGYKRPHSTTPSSSSSPQGGHPSRSKSSSDHWKSRHLGRKSASSGHSSRMRGEQRSGKETGSLSNAQSTSDNSSFRLDRQRYLQWKKEYQEWYEKYFSTYIGQFHQLHLPPPPYPEDFFHPPQGSTPVDGSSPSSDSPSYSRSSSSQSSSDGHSTPSHSSSDSSSSYRAYDGHSPPSRMSSHGRAAPSEVGAQPRENPERCVERYSGPPATLTKSSEDVTLQEQKTDEKQQVIKSVDELSALEDVQKKTKKLDGGRAEESSSPDSAAPIDESRDNKKELNSGPNVGTCDTAVWCKADVGAAVQSAPPILKPDKPLDKDYKRKAKEAIHFEKEPRWGRSKDSGSKRDSERKRRIKSSKQPVRLDSDKEEQPGGSEAFDSRSEKNRKRKVEDPQRTERESSLTVKPQSRKCPKTETTDQPESSKSESPKPFDRIQRKAEKKKERKTWPLTERDIWEGGVKVIPQKRISININLDVKKQEEKTDQLNLSDLQTCSEENKEQSEEKSNKAKIETQIEEKKEAIQEILSEEKINPDEQEVRQLWNEATFGEIMGEVEKKNAQEEEQDGGEKDLDLWHCAFKVEEGEEKSVSRKEEQAEETGKAKDHGKKQDMIELVLASQNEKAEREFIFREKTVERQREEGDAMRCSSQRSENQSHHEGCRNIPDDGSTQIAGSREGEDGQQKMRVVKTLQEGAGDARCRLAFMQMLCSKSENNEEKKDGGKIKVDTDTVALSHPSVTQTSRETVGDRGQQAQGSMEEEGDRDRVTARGRSKEKERSSTSSRSLSGVAPSGGGDRTDGTVSADRDKETRPERHRDRSRRGEGERKRESKGSKQGAREEERRDRECNKMTSVQRRDFTSSSHSSSFSLSHDTERRDWQQGGGQGGSKSSSHSYWKSSRGSNETSRATYLADQNPPRTHRDVSQDLKFKDKDLFHHYGYHQGYRDKDRPRRSHYSPPSLFHNHSKDRNLLPFEPSGGPQGRFPDWGLMRSKSQNESRGGKEKWKPEKVLKAVKEGRVERRGGGNRREDEANKLEGRRRPSSSSSSVSSSASHENSKDDKGEEGKEKEKRDKKEKRQTTPELQQEGDARKHNKSESSKDGAEEERGETGGR
ncbi:E3 ubiquitin-protein ligase RBBP6 isoform 2-T2 [Odontesthes bonariensis]|uniref:E3 ubiquitin-protein ligase RBBP6 isoform X2 n=1 Tax=Odontesthes bonariensis TaxID=219752 RepID=UPI003F585D48